MGQAFEQYITNLVRASSPAFQVVNDNAKQPTEELLVSLGGETRKLRRSVKRNEVGDVVYEVPLYGSSDHATCTSEHSHSSLLDLESSFASEESMSNLRTSRWETASQKTEAPSTGTVAPPVAPKRTPPLNERKFISSCPSSKIDKPVSIPTRPGFGPKQRSTGSIDVPPVLPRSLRSMPQDLRTSAPSLGRCSSGEFRSVNKFLSTRDILVKALDFATGEEDDSLEGSSHCHQRRTMKLPPPPPSPETSLSSPSPSSNSRGKKSPRKASSPRKTTSPRKSPSLSEVSSPSNGRRKGGRRSSQSPPSPAVGEGLTPVTRKQRSQRTLVVTDSEGLRDQYKDQLNIIF